MVPVNGVSDDKVLVVEEEEEGENLESGGKHCSNGSAQIKHNY